MDAAGRHHDFFGTSDGNAVGGSKLPGEEFQQAGHAGGLQVVAAVLVDGAAHAALTVSGASKLTSPWSSLNGLSTAYIMSRMRMMPEKGRDRGIRPW